MLVLIFERVKLILKLAELAGSRLQTHLSICFTYLELLGPANFKLICLGKLRLGLLMASILLFIVANLIVKLFKIVLECNYFILSGCDRVFKAEDVLVPLILHLSLVPDPILSRLDLRLQALH